MKLKGKDLKKKLLRQVPLILLFISVLNDFDFNYLGLKYFSFNFSYILILNSLLFIIVNLFFSFEISFINQIVNIIFTSLLYFLFSFIFSFFLGNSNVR